MTVSAVQQYVADLFSGVQSRFYPKGVLGMVDVPVPGVLVEGQAQAFVWGATFHEHRMTLSRQIPGFDPTLGQTNNAGWKQMDYGVSVWLYGVIGNKNPNRAVAFPVLINDVLRAWRQASMPTLLTDPITGAESKLMNIGENTDGDYDLDRTLKDQRLMRMVCKFDLTLLEAFRG